MPNIIFSKSSNLNDSVFGKSIAPIMMFVEKRAEAHEQLSVIKKIFHFKKSDHFSAKFTGMTSIDDFIAVDEGGAYPQTGMQEGYSKTINFDTFKQSFAITREMVEDNKILDLRSASRFISAYARTRERTGARLFIAAITNTKVSGSKHFDALSADGKTVFATNHPSKVKGGAQSNKFAGAFSNENLSKLETRMQNFCDDNGNLLAVAPDTILIPNDYKLKNDVFAAIGADKDPNTANNGFNYQFGRWNVIVWPELNALLGGSDKPYILLDSKYNTDYAGAVFIDRTPLEVRTYVDENTDNNIWKGRARFGGGFNDWRFAAVGGVTGGTSL